MGNHTLLKILKNNFCLLRSVVFNGGMFYVVVNILFRLSNIIFNVWFSMCFPLKITNYLLYDYPFWSIVTTILITIFSIIILTFLGSFYNMYIGNITEQKITKIIKDKFYKKAGSIELIQYQNNEFYNNYIRAQSEINSRFIGSVNGYINFLGCLVSMCIATFILNTLNWRLIIFVFIPLITNLIISSVVKKKKHGFDQEITPLNRRLQYYYRIAYLPEYIKENKSNGLYTLINHKYDETMDILTTKKISYTQKTNFLDFINETINLIFITIIPCLYAICEISNDSMDITFLIPLISGVVLIYNSINQIISFFPTLYENSLYYDNYKKFMEYESNMKSGTLKADSNIKEGLTINNLYFSYDDTKQVIKNVSMKIKPGEKIAIVGLNGAGKTTLIKLIMRLYDPENGNILLDGKDIREYTLDSYRGLYSTVFQDFKQYAFSVKENLYFEASDCTPDEEACNILDKVGILEKVESHKEGLYAEIGNEFSEGINFSGGESQKLAIARALAKNGSIIILDEASSALDPISERDLNESMLKTFQTKTMIIISHRLSTVINADKIYYFENGEILEQGNHSELIEARGQYYKLFSAQAEQYGINI